MPVEETSRESYKASIVEGLLAEKEAQYARALWLIGDATAQELYEYISPSGGRHVQANAHSALRYLYEVWMVDKAGTTRCPRSGRKVTVYRLVHNEPRLPRRGMTPAEALERIRATANRCARFLKSNPYTDLEAIGDRLLKRLEEQNELYMLLNNPLATYEEVAAAIRKDRQND